MKHKKQRYIQPSGPEDAMRIIQKLFNSYRNAPLTKELLDYHNNLISRLQSDIREAAVKSNNKHLLKQLDEMTDILRRWVSIRLSNRPFNAKMRHFKLVSDGRIKFKRHVHKINQTGDHRSSHH
ncbi:hypothetical protein [Limosilactobacillus fastidiosus]|uniref:Uncharacterized protein n=1 Tax=Limosilactobacillus fastidiosus TaxID=2759855 RepID=A0A7W3YCF2_9LACO|nr:hypothetical protein [Limosilactobacillus fastidiosus]MBB1062263.1 hypothetical protein [Limosilactobacillus fastidiosus]MBB1086669.1 hypothetical protein [Limosilactobacillus fastidiosus]MCD7083340.1 hypothetical protein [Limosilactobacillus fastidiosus]MCD7086353.1 hypothetical protein [Limosilactobacillus fastidiosus]MCD7115352.1 hypothetical protein [Limosilactobacillus fastidiosus]